MAKGPATNLANDFSEVLSFLQKKGIVPAKPTEDMMQVCRTVHHLTYTLILWRFRLRKLPPHGMIFIEEIASDALQVLPQLMMGYGKTVKLLTRGIAENTLRHIYFSDHPVEFERMNREKKWYLSNEQLLEYAKSHPAFIFTEPKFNALAKFSDVYSNLSAGIHGRAVRDLETRTALKKIMYEHASAVKDVELLVRCTQATNFLLAIFQQKQMLSFNVEDKRLILRTMPQVARAVWKDYEPTY